LPVRREHPPARGTSTRISSGQALHPVSPPLNRFCQSGNGGVVLLWDAVSFEQDRPGGQLDFGNTALHFFDDRSRLSSYDIVSALRAGACAATVTQRTTEIGIRLALGTERSAVLQMVLRQALRPVAAGVAVPLALFAPSWLRSYCLASVRRIRRRSTSHASL
jgi:hypothetical protein